MRLRERVLTRLVPLLVPACMVDTPVAAGDPAPPGRDLGAFCESLCARLDECGAEPAWVPCADACQTHFETTFVGRGDACESAVDRVTSCLEEASCNEIASNDGCYQWEEQGRCLESQGLVACRDEGGASGGAAGLCDVSLLDCFDGNEYRVSCPGTDDSGRCYCSVNDEVTGAFPALYCSNSWEAKRVCGWPIATAPGEPELPAVVSCLHSSSTGAAGGASVGPCAVEFMDCSDGHDYAFRCAPPEEARECSCEVDGEVAELISLESISPRGLCTLDALSASATANSVCGFRLASSAVIE